MEDLVLYSCCNCRNYVSFREDIMSKDFFAKSGPAILFSHAINIVVGAEKEDRQFLTGLHTVADISCGDCHEVLGWKYERAYEASQKYKEGKFIFEKSKIVKEGKWDDNNGAPLQGGDHSTEANDWRSKLPADSRQIIFDKIMETLKGHLPRYGGQEWMDKWKKTVEKFEEKIYAAATSQSDYVRKISVMMYTWDTNFWNTIHKPSFFAAQTRNTNAADWQKEVYENLKFIGKMYRSEQNEIFKNCVAAKLKQTDLSKEIKVSQTMKRWQLIASQVSGFCMPPNLKRELESYQKQMRNILIIANRPRKPVSSLQPGLHPSPHTHLEQQSHFQITQVQTPENQISPELQSLNLQGSVATMQQENVTGFQQNGMPTVSEVSAQQDTMNALQPSSKMDLSQGNSLSSPQQVHVGSLQETPASGKQANMTNALSPQTPTVDQLRKMQVQHLMQKKQMPQQEQEQQLKQFLLEQPQLDQIRVVNGFITNALPSSQSGINMLQGRVIPPCILQKQQEHQDKLLGQQEQQASGQSQTLQLPQLHQTSVAKDVNVDSSSSQTDSNMLKANMDSLQLNSIIVDNQHLKQEQDQKKLQNQLKKPYQQTQLQQEWTQKPQMLQETLQLQMQKLQQQAKQQLHHIYVIYLMLITIMLGAAFLGTGY